MFQLTIAANTLTKFGVEFMPDKSVVHVPNCGMQIYRLPRVSALPMLTRPFWCFTYDLGASQQWRAVLSSLNVTSLAREICAQHENVTPNLQQMMELNVNIPHYLDQYALRINEHRVSMYREVSKYFNRMKSILRDGREEFYFNIYSKWDRQKILSTLGFCSYPNSRVIDLMLPPSMAGPFRIETVRQDIEETKRTLSVIFQSKFLESNRALVQNYMKL